MKFFFLILVLTFPVSAFAQSPDTKPSSSAKTEAITLTDDEQKQWQQFAQAEKQRTDVLNQAQSDLLNTQTGADSATVHGRYQSAWLALQWLTSQRREWLANARLKYDCKDCSLSEDGKQLVPAAK